MEAAGRVRYLRRVGKEKIQILFVSRRGNVRSTLAAACLQFLAGHRFTAFACGQPGSVAHEPHAVAMDTLRRASMVAPAVIPRDWDDFRRMTAPRMHFVITLDATLGPPPWPGQPETALWSYPDLLQQPVTDDLPRHMTLLLHSLRRRLELLAALPIERASRVDLRNDLRDLAFTP